MMENLRLRKRFRWYNALLVFTVLSAGVALYQLYKISVGIPPVGLYHQFFVNTVVLYSLHLLLKHNDI